MSNWLLVGRDDLEDLKTVMICTENIYSTLICNMLWNGEGREWGTQKRGRYLGGGFSLSLRLGSHKVAANEEDERGYRRIYWNGRSIVNVHKTFHSFKLKPIGRVWPRNSEIHQQIDLSYKILQWWLVDEREATVKDNEVVAHFPAILQNPGHTCTHAHGVISPAPV